MSGPPTGSPPFKGRVAAYRELMKTLWYASETFRDEGDGGIEGAKLACQAVARFIAVRHENPELAAPFLAIRAAFQDLERGVGPDLFSTNTSLRKRSRSSERKHLQMLASVAMDIFMMLGDSQDQAASKVAQYAQHWPGFDPRSVTPVSIRNWRDSLVRLDPPHRVQFDKLREFILSQPSPQSEVERLLSGPPGVAKT